MKLFQNIALYVWVVRTLFKFVRKFEAVLAEPCAPWLVEQKSSGSTDNVDIQQEDTPLHQLHRALKSALPGRGRDLQVWHCVTETVLDSETSTYSYRMIF